MTLIHIYIAMFPTLALILCSQTDMEGIDEKGSADEVDGSDTVIKASTWNSTAEKV